VLSFAVGLNGNALAVGVGHEAPATSLVMARMIAEGDVDFSKGRGDADIRQQESLRGGGDLQKFEAATLGKRAYGRGASRPARGVHNLGKAGAARRRWNHDILPQKPG